MPTQELLREKPPLTQFAFNRLLEWLDDGADSQGGTYLEMRRRLVSYFDRRNRLAPDELADETLNRIGRTLEQSRTISISPPARYCYLVAKFVMLEDIRRERRLVSLDESHAAAARSAIVNRDAADDEFVMHEERLASLDRCLQMLKPDQRELIVEYYRDAGREKIERRRNLANRLGISMNALGIRAYRIRDTLMSCVESTAPAA